MLMLTYDWECRNWIIIVVIVKFQGEGCVTINRLFLCKTKENSFYIWLKCTKNEKCYRTKHFLTVCHSSLVYDKRRPRVAL